MHIKFVSPLGVLVINESIPLCFSTVATTSYATPITQRVNCHHQHLGLFQLKGLELFALRVIGWQCQIVLYSIY
jgi:hypothetical protein